MPTLNLTVLIIVAVGAAVVGLVIAARHFLNMGDETPVSTPEEAAKQELEQLLTVEQPPEGKKIEDEVGND